MTPITPVVPGTHLRITMFGAKQPQYRALPGHRTEDGVVTTRWQLTWRERLSVLAGGCIWLQVRTFNKPLQPVALKAGKPKVEKVTD
jgi:hypothetical protein